MIGPTGAGTGADTDTGADTGTDADTGTGVRFGATAIGIGVSRDKVRITPPGGRFSNSSENTEAEFDTILEKLLVLLFLRVLALFIY